MMQRVSFSLALTCGLLISSAHAQELIDFTGISDGNQWNGAVDQLSVSGNYTFTGSGFLQDGNTTAFMYTDDAGITNGTVNPIQSVSQILDLSDVAQSFSVNSVDWRANAGNGGTGASLIGYTGGAGGTEAWRISGPQDLDPPITYSTPTTGDFATLIDTIVWDIPNYEDGEFGHTIDNLNFTLGPPPPSGTVFDFAGVSDGSTWNGLVDDVSDDGLYTFTGGGFMQEFSTTVAMFEDDAGITNGTVNPIQSISQVLDVSTDVAQEFTVNSIDWRAASFSGGATASLIGYSGGETGTEQWRISGPQELDPGVTFTAPTTGSFANAVDTIVWDIPDYEDGEFGHAIYNVDVDVIGPVSGGDPADLNNDGFVDGLDLGILLGNWGSSTTPDMGELDGTPPVDGLDLGILLGAWNPPPLAAAASVPEPSSTILCLLGGLLISAKRRNSIR